ncbi:MAG: hypothetical protein ARM1_0657 [Candidatus Micrarchaeota archaeon]|nr:MAG: hypothetical protein ARM1_0657 [Candidatus Micrarchaeota archaeon]
MYNRLIDEVNTAIKNCIYDSEDIGYDTDRNNSHGRLLIN